MKPWPVRPLVLDDVTRPLIKKVMAFAEAHRIDISTMQAMVDGDVKPPGDNMNFTCVIPIGYRCVFTVEQQPAPLNWCRHLSVSVINGPAPGEHAVNMLLKEFGMNCAIEPEQFKKLEPEFKGGWPDYVKTEDIAKGQVAVSVIKRI